MSEYPLCSGDKSPLRRFFRRIKNHGRVLLDDELMATRPAADDAAFDLAEKAGAENFPVALAALPRRLRTDLFAIYDVARTIDDLGDNAPGGPDDRSERLESFSHDLARVWGDGRPEHPVLQRLVPTARRRNLGRDPFDRLVLANLQDQTTTRYGTYDGLLRYCTLSANPVGELVLAVFGVESADAVELSNRVCTALQLIEHWQDVAEDRRAGRVYLPLEDLAAFGVPESDLDRPTATPDFRRLMTYQIRRTADLLDSGAPLVGLLSGWARLAVAGYIAGGKAALDALAGADVLRGAPRGRRVDLVRHAIRLLMRGGS